MQTVTRKLWFSAGHRVYGHESQCANLHGHNYIVQITAAAERLDDIGRVIDFKVLKDKIDPWLQKNWDHAFLYNEKDLMCEYIFKHLPNNGSPLTEELHGMKHYSCPFNPTAEEMANYLLREVCPDLLSATGVIVLEVELWETENCKAHASLDWVVQDGLVKPTLTPTVRLEIAL